jgi:oxygen-dependent protoporphyrinogen oxidase
VREKTFRVAIIGAGISGLAAAHKFDELFSDNPGALELSIFEAGSRAGGTIKSYEREGFLLEGGPDSFISEKPEALRLAARLGLLDRLIQTNAANRRSFIVRNGRLLPVPEGFQLLAPSIIWPFISSPIFSWRGKARMALDLVIPPKQLYPDSDESLASFVRRRLGTEALDRMAQPMIGGIYTADPEQLSLRATMPRFLEMEREHGSVIRAMIARRRRSQVQQTKDTSGARYSLFLSFDRGIQVLVDSLVSKIGHARIRFNRTVSSLRSLEAGRWALGTNEGNEGTFDAVVIALPAHRAAQLLDQVDSKISAALASIPYASTATINLAYNKADVPHPLDGFGFVVPRIEGRKIIACSFSSTKYPGRAPQSGVLLRAFAGGALQPEIFDLNEAELLRAVLDEMRALLGITAAPVFSIVEKWPRSMAQYHLGHPQLVSQLQTRVAAYRGLQLAGNAYEGAGIPDCIRSGEAAADLLVGEFLAASSTQIAPPQVQS